MDHIDAFNADEQDAELDPHDAWLMRAAGGEDEFEEGAAAIAIPPRDDDQFSFEDSERFEEDSLCSWMSDTESLNQNWRGWNTARSSSAHLPTTDLGFPDGNAGTAVGHRYTGGISTSSVCQHGRHSAASSSSGAIRAGSPLSPPSCTAPNKVDRTGTSAPSGMRSLAEMAARKAARYYSFDALESSYHCISSERRRMALEAEGAGNEKAALLIDSAFMDHAAIPDKFFLSIVRWCFPESEEDIRLYSCLANGNADEFGRGEYLYQSDAVRDVFQIGYHLSAIVTGSISGSMSGGALAVVSSSGAPAASTSRQSKTAFNVSVRVDRCRIVSCSCSCAFKASWCQHVVAVCLHRINRSQDVEYRVTIWDSINELSNEKLKKLAQFLINDLPRQYLPLAQRLIDQLKNPNSEINAAVGAPDPTDGGHEDIAIWCLDQRTLHENIRRILIKFCIPSPTVHCDVQYLSSNQPPAASEWQSLLRPHRSKDPEGLWNLLSIVREMFKRRDENATSLLHIITEECLACSQVLMWWYQTSLSQSGKWSLCSSSSNKPSSLMSSQNAPQFNCASLCEEIVQLWRLAALNPRLSEVERDHLASFLQVYHRNAVERIWKNICSASPEAVAQSQTSPLIGSVVDRRGDRLSTENARFTVDLFPGFLPALKACRIGWEGIVVEGVGAGTRPAFNPSQFLSVSCSVGSQSDSSAQSPNLHYSPNIPILRHHSRVAETTSFLTAADASTAFYRNALYQAGSGLYSTHQQASRSSKRRKKSSRVTRRRGHQLEFHDERSLVRAARAAAHAARDIPLGEEVEEDSAESGQESEDAPTSSRVADSQNGVAGPSTSGAQALDATKTRHPKLVSGDVDELFAHAHVPQTNWDVKFARCEALMSHGYSRQACEMAAELAKEMIERPPDLLHCVPRAESRTDHEPLPSAPRTGNKLRRRKISQSGSTTTSAVVENAIAELDCRLIETSELAANTFSRTIFLVQSLMKESKTHWLAFSLAIFVLELPRGPAATKFLEVKLYYLETELVALLRRLEIGAAELRTVRDRARRFIENASVTASRPCVLPISLAHYILDALSYSHNVNTPCQGRRSASGIATRSNVQRVPCDEELAVKVAIEALGMKLMASEADYPMLCESTRRQRGELALTMLMRYKDCNEFLALVLDKLLDPTMHRMYKDHQSNAAFYLEQDPVHNKLLFGQRPRYPFHGQCSDWLKEHASNTSKTEVLRRQGSCESADGSLMTHTCEELKMDNLHCIAGDDGDVEQISEAFVNMTRESADESSSLGSTGQRRSSDEGNESPGEESSSSGISRGLPLDPARCSLMDSQPASAGTSKSPSPAHHIVPASVQNAHTTDAICTSTLRPGESSSAYYRHNRRKPIPSSPNQASEAQAHYMMELAKRLLVEAGGSQSTVIFNASQNIGGQNNPQHNGPHRQLHICSFLIGLYALGLNNLVSTSWQTRTYSTNVSWIHGQAIEIGCAAIKIVERVWEAHLTPTEVAALADKASQSRDPGMVEAAARLALSVLPKAYALTAAESQKALHQCKDQSPDMLEKACKAVEQAAEKDGVYPEVLFKVARHWYELFCENDQQQSASISQGVGVNVNTSLAQFCSTSGITPTQTETHPQIHQSFPGSNVNPGIMQMPLQFTGMQLPQQGMYAQPQFYHVPPNQAHQPGPSHRPSMLVAPVNSTQPQMIMQYAPRGAMGNSALSMTSSVHGAVQQQQPCGVQPSVGSSRVLHVSHSAPNLSPLQAVQMCRRGVQPSLPPNAHPQYAPLGAIPSPAVQTITEHVAQPNSMTLSGPMHHLHPSTSLIPTTSLMHYTQMGSMQGHVVQSNQQMSGLHHQPPPNTTFHPQGQMNSMLSSAGGMLGGDPRMVKLVHAHRVGMKAMETMGTRNLDDNRSYAKFSQNPAYAEDVRWLFSIAVKLGGVFTQSFCEVAARSIASPFVLFSLAVESTKVFHWQMPAVNYHSPSLLHPIVRSQMASGSSATKHNHAPQVRSVLMQSGFAAPTADLMQHCVEMFYMAASSKLSHPRFVPSDTEEVVQLVKTARDAFFWIPGPGKLMFDDFMRHVRKQKACKKDVAQRINACIQQPS